MFGDERKTRGSGGMIGEPWIACKECDSPDFYVLWKSNGYDIPHYCPFCGWELYDPPAPPKGEVE